MCNILMDTSGSWFVGDSATGFGQILVTLHEAVFDSSKIIGHTAKLIYILQRKHIDPPVLVFQSDGGVDCSIKQLQTKLALVELFKKMDLDHLLVLRCAPNGSAYDKIQRAMSPLNGVLVNVATKRAPVSDGLRKL